MTHTEYKNLILSIELDERENKFNYLNHAEQSHIFSLSKFCIFHKYLNTIRFIRCC